MDNSSLTEVPTPDSTDALQFELNGYQLGWRPSGLALKRASDRGMELGEILVELQTLFEADVDPEELDEDDLDEEDLDLSSGFSDLTSVFAKLIWLGTLHFEAQIKLEAILALIDPGSLEDLPIDQMLQRVFPAIEDEMDEGTDDEEESAGK